MVLPLGSSFLERWCRRTPTIAQQTRLYTCIGKFLSWNECLTSIPRNGQRSQSLLVTVEHYDGFGPRVSRICCSKISRNLGYISIWLVKTLSAERWRETSYGRIRRITRSGPVVHGDSTLRRSAIGTGIHV